MNPQTIKDLNWVPADANQPTQEVTWINAQGKEVRPLCRHFAENYRGAIIPGLDASLCKVCHIWFIDQQIRDRVLNRRYLEP